MRWRGLPWRTCERSVGARSHWRTPPACEGPHHAGGG